VRGTEFPRARFAYCGGTPSSASTPWGGSPRTRSAGPPIEEVRAGDRVWSRDESDAGREGWREVEEAFSREAEVVWLTLDGRRLGTTAEHPFWAEGRGWTKAGDLRPGDRVRTLGEGTALVERVEAGGRARVYNFRVAGFHTYFVGGEGWGFGVWAHNADCYIAALPASRAAVELRNAVLGRIIGENTRRGMERFTTAMLSERELVEVVKVAKGLKGVTTREVESLVLLAHRADKRIPVADLLTQMGWLNTGRLRGFPAAFSSHEGFSRFTGGFTSLLRSVGIPADDINLQGSVLRKLEPPDVDIMGIIERKQYNRLVDAVRKAMRTAEATKDQVRLPEEQLADDRINLAVLKYLGGGGFDTRIQEMLATRVSEGILHRSVTKMDFSLTHPDSFHAKDGLTVIWRLGQTGG
jgi:hypothetical protein